MKPEEFFDGSIKTRSVISLIVENCIESMCRTHHANPDGSFTATDPTSGDTHVLTSEEMVSEIRNWVKELEGGDPLQSRVSVMVRANPGWETIVAMRAVRELRRRRM
jgi:hypothetical protein